MCSPIVHSDAGPSDVLQEFIWLLSEFQFTEGDLTFCGVDLFHFSRIVRLMRSLLTSEGWIVL